jgi:pSer/pThr/pTyr-binding forkhead associated (FHA) protein
MDKTETITLATIQPESLKDDNARLVLEEGSILFIDSVTKEYVELEKGKEYILRKVRNQAHPITIGREEPSSLSDWMGIKKRKDIILPKKYGCTSRKQCEIFYDDQQQAYFLADYSLNGTLVNASKVGGTRQREAQKLNDGDVIEIPAVGENVKLTFLLR